MTRTFVAQRSEFETQLLHWKERVVKNKVRLFLSENTGDPAVTITFIVHCNAAICFDLPACLPACNFG